MGRPAHRALLAAGYRTLDELPADLRELQRLHGVGGVAVEALTRARRSPEEQALLDSVVAQIRGSGDPRAGLAQLLQALGNPLLDGLIDDERNRAIDLPDPPLHPALLTVRVDLRGAKPPIWRRLELRGDLTLEQLHDHLQAAMGWTDSHLHRFWPAGAERSASYFVTDVDVSEGDDGTHERDARLDQVLRHTGEVLAYEYDFGDSWEHRISLERQRPATDDDPPSRCLAGRGQCPPEDVGGIHMWNDVAAVLRSRGPSGLIGDLEMYAAWLPADVAPDSFDVAETNRLLALVGQEVDPGELWRTHLSADGEAVPPPHDALIEVLSRCSGALADELSEYAAIAAVTAVRPSDGELAEALRPWLAMLTECGADGIPLTQAGWMAPASCERLWQTSGLAWPVGKGNREQHTPELMMLRESCTEARLIRRFRGRLVLTPGGRAAARDLDECARLVAAHMLSGREEFELDCAVVALLLVGSGWQPDPSLLFDQPAHARAWSWQTGRAVARTLGELGWRDDQGRAPQYLAREVGRMLQLLIGHGLQTRQELPGVRYLARLALFP